MVGKYLDSLDLEDLKQLGPLLSQGFTGRFSHSTEQPAILDLSPTAGQQNQDFSQRNDISKSSWSWKNLLPQQQEVLRPNLPVLQSALSDFTLRDTIKDKPAQGC